MKSILSALVGLMAFVSISVSAEILSAPHACGTRYMNLVSYVSSDSFQSVDTTGAASLVLRGTQYKTDIVRVTGYTPAGVAYDLTWDAQSQTSCDGKWGRLCENDYVQVCFAQAYEYVTISTTGTYMANYAIYLGH